MLVALLTALLLASTALAEEPAAEEAATDGPAAEAPTVKAPIMASGIRDVFSEVEKGKCETPQLEKMQNKKPPGADQHYGGTFTVASDGTVEGVEKRLLFANDIWKSRPEEQRGSDCVVVWNIKGSKAEPTACDDCAFGIHFQADVDYGASTCPKRITTDGNHFRGAYDVRLKEDDTLEIVFSNSGNPLGHGYHYGGQYNWLSPHKCAWF